MSRNAFLLPLVLLFAIASSSVINSVMGQNQIESLDFRFRALAVGECVVGYGEVGLPLEWVSLGDGQARISGYATDAVLFPLPFLNIYVSENVKAKGMINVGWTGEEGSKYRLAVNLYSTETSEGAFIPEVNGFALTATTLPDFSPEKTLSFSGIYVNDSEVQIISGRALFGASIYGPPPFKEYIGVFLGLEELGIGHTAFSVVWSRSQTEIGLGQNYLDPPFITLSAARVYESLVSIT